MSAGAGPRPGHPGMIPAGRPTPYWRLSGFYFFYFGSLGALLPFWGPYLRALGFGEAQIGELVAVIMATRIIAPNIWGWISDRCERPMRVVRLASFLAVLCFAGVFIASGYWWLALVMVAFSFFWNATLPLLEATTLTHLGARPQRYSSIRLWGSIGFIAAVLALGALFDRVAIQWLAPLLLVLFSGIWLSTLLVPEARSAPPHTPTEPLGRVVGRPAVATLLLSMFLLQASHGPYYTFYTLYLEDHGYSRSLVGQLWALGVVAEIVLFLCMHRLLPVYGSRSLLLLALAVTALRWVLIGAFPQHLGVLVAAQLLHAASFGVVHAVAIHLVHHFFVGANQRRGQALYSSVSFGAGGAAGSLLGGYLWTSAGAFWAFMAAAAVALCSLAVAWIWVRTRY